MSEFALSNAQHYGVNPDPSKMQGEAPSGGVAVGVGGPDWYTSTPIATTSMPANGPAGSFGAGGLGVGAGSNGPGFVGGYGMGGFQQYGGAGAAAYSFDHSMAGAGGAAYGSFEDEPPLLEELGIDIPGIISHTKAVLLMRLSGSDVANLDLGGPFIFMSLMGIAHLLIGKLHFGYILGWTVVASLFAWFVFSRIAGPESDADEENLDVYSCCCILGYSMLPLVLHALGSLLLPRRSTATLVTAMIAVLWSAHTATKLFVHKWRGLRSSYPIIMYPCTLMYTAFVLLTLY